MNVIRLWRGLGIVVMAAAVAACGAGGVSVDALPEEAARAAEVASTAASVAAEQGAAALETVQASEAAGTAVAVAGTRAVDALATAQAFDISQVQDELSGLDFDVSALQARFAALSSAAGEPVTATVTAEEINTALRQREETAAEPPRIRNAMVFFDDGLIRLTGRIEEPLSGDLVVDFLPTIVDGRLQFEVVGATFGQIQVPQGLLGLAAGMLNGTLGAAVNVLPPQLALQSATVADGVLTLVAGPTAG